MYEACQKLGLGFDILSTGDLLERIKALAISKCKAIEDTDFEEFKNDEPPVNARTENEVSAKGVSVPMVVPLIVIAPPTN